MRLSSAPMSGEQGATTRSIDGGSLLLSARRSMAALMAMFIVLATVGVMAATSSPARADTPYATGQVFVSVGNGQIYVFDPASGQQLPDPQGTLTDSTVNIPPPAGIPSQFTAGTAFDANGDLFVADGTNGTISEFSPTGAPIGVNGYFASGLANPAALVFDQAGDLFVGQVDSPYIAEFSPSGQRLPDIGKLKIQTRGVDWIDLSTDQCTFYYTSEGNAVMAYNMCTKTQLPDFTQQPLAGPAAFELRIMPNTGAYNGDVLVADTDRVVLLDSSGNVAQTYLCNGPELSNWGCAGRIFGLSLDPDGTSFWTTDPFSGLVWKIDIATGTVLQAINTNAANLYGISVLGAPTAAVKQATTVASTTTAVNLLPLTTPLQYGVPTTVQAEVTATTANGTTTPLANEPVDFTLSGGVTCTGTTDANGIATCVIIPGQSSGTYTLSATFTGDTSQSTPISSSVSVPNDVTVNPETTDLTYTGPTSGVNGQPFTFSGTLTTPPGDAPLPPGQPVTFTIGSGNTAQSCTGTVDSSGNVSCTVTLDQPVSNVTITTTYEGTPYLAPSSPSGTGAVITEPTTLTVQHATGDFIDTTSVQATLSDASNNPVAGQFVTLTFNNNSNESCTVKTDANGLASCPITPSAPADGQGTYPLTASFAGDASLPLQLTGSTGANTFTVTLEPTTLTYTGATVTQNGQSLAVSGVLTTENSKDADSDMSAAAPIAGRTVTFVLGSGLNAQSCSAVTDSTGTAACAIGPVSQSPGPIPVTDQFAGDNYFEQASAASTVNLPEGTQLTVNPPSTTPIYNGPTTLSGTLTNTYTNQPVSGEPVTFTINGTQSCTADTNASGVASCTLSPNEPAGTYSYTATFTGDNTSMPQLTPSVATSTISVTTAPTTLTYTGPTSVTNGSPATFSGTLTTSEPTSGTDVSGVPVTFTIGSGNTAQSCTGTTTASGYVTCTIPSVLQTTGTVTVTDSFSGNSYYSPQTYTTSATVHTPTTLTVSDTSPAVYGGTTSLTGDLTNAVTGQPIPNEPVTLTLNGTQSCQATTDANGIATCTVMLNEPAGSYTLSGTFGGQSSNLSQPSLNPSGGTNTVTVSKAPTTTTFTSPTVVVNGWSTTLSATVSTSLGSGLTGQPVTLTIGSGSTAQSCTGTVDASGHVTCTIPTLNQVSGTLPVTVSYGGNSYYQSSSSTSTVIVASAPGSGGFVVGNVSAGATTTPKTIGNLVNFWGSQTWKTNKFTGVNNAPASMKGYIDQAPHLSATACGSTWTSDTGNSSNPPATIPPYMLVVVSSYISQGASTEYGDIQHLAVVQVGNGYGPAPGHNGWGNVVAWIC